MTWNRLNRICSGSGWKSKPLCKKRKLLCSVSNPHKQKLNGSKHYWLNQNNNEASVPGNDNPKSRIPLRSIRGLLNPP